MKNNSYIFVGMGNANVGYSVLKKRLAVIVVTEIYFLVEKFIEQGPYGKSLLPQRLTLYPRNFLHLV